MENAVQWKQHEVGKMQIVSDSHDLNKVQLLVKRENETTFVLKQVIGKETFIDQTQMSEGVLSWIGRDLSEYNSVEDEQWAIKFDDIAACKQFYNVILVATAVCTQMPKVDFSGTIEDTHRLLEFSTKETSENFKQRCVNAYMSMKIEQLSRNIQTWNDVNVSLGIKTESQRCFYERLCQYQKETLTKQSTEKTDMSNNQY